MTLPEKRYVPETGGYRYYFTVQGERYYIEDNGLMGSLAAWDVRHEDGYPVAGLPPYRTTLERAIRAAKRDLR
jgi:hypothetical protein